MQQYIHYLLLLLFLLLLPTLLFLANLSLFQNRPPLLSVPCLTSPLPRAHILYIILN